MEAFNKVVEGAASMLATAAATASEVEVVRTSEAVVAVVTEEDLDMGVAVEAVMKAKGRGLQHTWVD